MYGHSSSDDRAWFRVSIVWPDPQSGERRSRAGCKATGSRAACLQSTDHAAPARHRMDGCGRARTLDEQTIYLTCTRQDTIPRAREGHKGPRYIMKVDGRHIRSIWLEPARHDRQRDRPAPAAAPFCRRAADGLRRRGGRDQLDAGARCAADRRDRRVRDGAGDARRCLRCVDRPRLSNADRDAADRDQFEMGARRNGALLRPLPPSDRTAAAYSRAAEISEEDIAINRGIGEHGIALIKRSRQPRSTASASIS